MPPGQNQQPARIDLLGGIADHIGDCRDLAVANADIGLEHVRRVATVPLRMAVPSDASRPCRDWEIIGGHGVPVVLSLRQVSVAAARCA